MLSGSLTRCRPRRWLRFISPPRTNRRRAESGYAFVMAMFLIVAMLVSSQVVLRNMVTLRRREREADSIWRGQQYVRAIRLYYHKTGHYPQSLEDLEKGLPELHFLRFCAYKDPINSTDGSWRFIYVNSTGGIIGSVRYATLQQMALIDLNGGKLPGPQPGTPAADLAAASGSDDNANTTANSGANSGAQAPQPQQGQAAPQPPQSTTSSSAFGAPGSPSGVASGLGATSIGLGTNGAPGQDQTANPLLLLKPTGPVDGPVLGAFITGVASKVDQPSLRVYKGGKKYLEWEFIWNPLEDQARAVQNGLSTVQGSQQQQQPGQFGLPIGPVNGTAPGQPQGGPAAPQQAQPQQTPPPASNPD